MSYKEVMQLRQNGDLHTAYKIAFNDLQLDPENIWHKRAIGWVYYDFLKNNASVENFNNFKKCILKIKELDLPEDENMIFDNCVWQISKMLNDISKLPSPDFDKVNTLFNLIKSFHFTVPSKYYTILYLSFHKLHKTWSRYLEFADWWSFDNFQAEDYVEEELNGKKIISTVEKAYNAYSKKLLTITSDLPNDYHTTYQEKIALFIPKLKRLVKEYPHYRYSSYYLAKLLLITENKKEGLLTLLPFVRKKQNDFWVWETLADFFNNQDQKDIQFSCYCKALSLKIQDHFLTNIRQSFIKLLIEKKMYNEASIEINKICRTKQNNNHKIPKAVVEWTTQNWYVEHTHNKNNHKLYKQYTHLVENILYLDLPEELIVVSYVNRQKNILNFIKNKYTRGFFNYSALAQTPEIGDVLRVRLQKVGDNGFYKTLTIEKEIKEEPEDIIKTSTGKIVHKEGNNFAFINNIYINEQLLTTHELRNEQEITVKALLTYNKKKNTWGWSAIKIIP